ncbi:methyl-accepting chemotaxis protein [Vibrio gazogenes]|uniref:Methyl-accepting chemotaxis protein n=1 Tax=Vibrio gazogenes DSM 21264 = NBRC 103151 TaxID=1123492 RepID=A0A1M4SSR7_VIBGA|nr:methyl-accepting chemotaxis protein [Vibrio gazogenes]USP15938.1 methyl-accepting chemotaxis protein [Vibrio gazogenes]SHE35228.1 methyl-accepting chemotaxis protein [Vibrio gazogenes DSM 21264] [Vibrio gazogenes DSM 21264 = NBRC 103151]
MNYFKNLGIRWKLCIPLILVMLLVLTLSGRSLYSEGLQAEAITIVTRQEIPALSLVQSTNRDLYQAWVAERSMLTLPVKSEQYQLMQKMHDDSIKTASQSMEKLKSFQLNAEMKQLVEQFWKTYPEWVKITGRIEQERSSNSRAGRSTAIGLSFNEGFELFQKTQHHLELITDIVAFNADERTDKLEEMHQNYRSGQLWLVGFSLLICLGIIWFFPLLITGDLKNITQQIQALAKGGGDLTKRLKLNRRDELGELAAYLDKFMSELHHLVTQIISNAQENNVHVSSLGEMSRKACQTAEKQVISMREVSSSSQEMNVAIQDVSLSTSEVSDSTKKAGQSASEGGQQVSTTQQSIGLLNESVEQAVAAISRIDEFTNKISSVLTIISGIAEQTNLLALNAAIEAARAGDSGRGFAVVADEVRGLANKTQSCTEDVNEMITNLEKSVQDAVQIMNQATERASVTKQASENTQRAIDDMMMSMDHVTERTTQIAAVIVEQSKMAKHIQEEIRIIEAQSQESVEESSEVDQACRKLDELHRHLSQVLGKFTV